MHGASVTEMSIAAAIFDGERNRYAMFLCAAKAEMLLLGGREEVRDIKRLGDREFGGKRERLT